MAAETRAGETRRGKLRQRKTTVGNPDGEILQGLDQTEDISKWGTRTGGDTQRTKFRNPGGKSNVLYSRDS